VDTRDLGGLNEFLFRHAILDWILHCGWTRLPIVPEGSSKSVLAEGGPAKMWVRSKTNSIKKTKNLTGIKA